MRTEPGQVVWICGSCPTGYDDLENAALHSERANHWVYEVKNQSATGGDRHGWAVPTGRSTHGSDSGPAYLDDGKDPDEVRGVFLNRAVHEATRIAKKTDG